MTDKSRAHVTRRTFLGTAGKGLAATSMALGFPSIVPATVFGQASPSNRITVGMIGTGRISRDHDMPGVWQHDLARIVAVCDLDRKRLGEGKQLVNSQYAKQTGRTSYDGVTAYTNYRDLLANRDIDAVVVSTPDHWHALIAIDAVEAGKHKVDRKLFWDPVAERFKNDDAANAMLSRPMRAPYMLPIRSQG